MTQHESCAEGRRNSLWKRLIFTSVDPARGHIDSWFNDTAKRRNAFRLRRLRCTDRPLSGLDTVIVVTCVICERLLFWDVPIWDGYKLKMAGKSDGALSKTVYCSWQCLTTSRDIRSVGLLWRLPFGENFTDICKLVRVPFHTEEVNCDSRTWCTSELDPAENGIMWECVGTPWFSVAGKGITSHVQKITQTYRNLSYPPLLVGYIPHKSKARRSPGPAYMCDLL